MTRERKSPEERKALLLESADQLFGQQGYSATSVMDIASAAGVGKSTFFYYYANKEEILYALVSHWGQQVVADFQGLYYGENAKTRLIGFIRALAVSYRMPLLERLFKDQEMALMMGSFDRVLEESFNPVLQGILEQGQEAGNWHLSNMAVTIHFFWAVVDGLLDAYEEDEELSVEEGQARLAVYRQEAEKLLVSLLGLEDGGLSLDLPMFNS